MKIKHKTIQAKSFEELDKRISVACFILKTVGYTVSRYHGRNTPLTKSWRSLLGKINHVRNSTRVAFGRKISD